MSYYVLNGASLMAQLVKNPSANAEEAGDSGSIPGWENSLETEMESCSNILAWKIPWTKEPGIAAVHGVTKSWTWLSTHTHTHTHMCLIFTMLGVVNFIVKKISKVSILIVTVICECHERM